MRGKKYRRTGSYSIWTHVVAKFRSDLRRPATAWTVLNVARASVWAYLCCDVLVCRFTTVRMDLLRRHMGLFVLNLCTKCKSVNCVGHAKWISEQRCEISLPEMWLCPAGLMHGIEIHRGWWPNKDLIFHELRSNESHRSETYPHAISSNNQATIYQVNSL